ncbi:MAG: PEP-CTERM sorting domain-containing protein [Phycisphaeraceae bacterium]
MMCVLVMAGLSCLWAAPAHGVPMVVISEYERSPGLTVATEAFFDTVGLTGTGREEVQIVEFNLKFSDRAYTQSAEIAKTVGIPAVSPFPEKTLVAVYLDGMFDQFASVDRGGNPRMPVDPPANWLGESISLAKNSLVDFPCCSGFSTYTLTSRTGPVVVPEPGSVLLMEAGVVGLMMRRRRKCVGGTARERRSRPGSSAASLPGGRTTSPGLRVVGRGEPDGDFVGTRVRRDVAA